MPDTYKCAVLKEAHSKLSFEEREIPTPADDQVLIKVAACGVCLGDKVAVHNIMPVQYPRVPGHEVVGHVVAVGSGVKWPAVGAYVGVGWHGGHCLFCASCRKGDFMACPAHMTTGLTLDGGYQEYMLAHWTGIAEMPADLDPVIAAPLLCAGVTMFNGIRHQTHLHPGDLVAIHGIGGLGHLGIQFAKKMGYRVVAISTSDSKKELAIKLGADHYIDVSETPASDQLRALGGASLIVTTSPNAESMGDLINGLGTNGRLMIVGADAASFPVSPFQLIGKKSGICGWASGTATDSEDTCRFAELTGVESINEVFPFEKAQEAYDYMCSGKCRFRVVIKMSE